MAGGTSLGRLYVDLLMNTGSFETDAGRAAKIAEKRAAEIDRAIAKMGDRVTGKFKAVGASVAGFAAGFIAFDAIKSRVQEAIDYADRLDELSARLDVGTEKLSGWGYAAKLSGVDLDTLASALPKLSKQIAAGGELWDALGIKTKDANGKLRDVEDILPEVADRFAALNNATLEQALAQEIFGKSGAEMLEFLNRGGAGLRSMEEKARSLGIVIDKETAAKAAEFKDQLDNVEAATTGLTTQLAAGLLPEMTEIATAFSDVSSDADTLAASIVVLQLGIEGLKETAFAAPKAILDIGEAASSVIGKVSKLLNVLPDGVPELPGGAQNLPVNYSSGPSSRGGRRAKLPVVDEGRATRYLAGGARGGKSGAPKLSDEAKEAQELARRYDQLMASMAERIAMAKEEAAIGDKVGEAWKVAYDTQFGDLAKLKPEQKAQLQASAELIDSLAKQQAAAQKALEQKTGAADMVRQIDLEREALGLTNHELAVREALLRANIPAGSEFAAGIEASVTALEKAQQRVAALDGVRSIADDFFVNLPTKGIQAWQDALAQIETLVLQWAAKGIVQQLFGQYGTDGSGNTGGFLSGVLGSIFGGGTNTAGGIFASIFGGGRAEGGPVMGGKMYAITEKGLPELLNFGGQQMLLMPPGKGGHVTPMRAGRSGGGVTQVVNHNYAAPFDARTADQAAARNGRDARRALARNG